MAPVCPVYIREKKKNFIYGMAIALIYIGSPAFKSLEHYPLSTNRRDIMGKTVVVLDSDKKECLELCSMIEEQSYTAAPIHSFPKMEDCIQKEECEVALMDIDSVPLDNRTIRKLTIKYPGVHFLCMSRDRHHPDLQEALCYHIYACIYKPVDPDELFYWLKSIHENNEIEEIPSDEEGGVN